MAMRSRSADAARQVAELIGRHGASFFYEPVERTACCPQVGDALAEPVSHGFVTSDRFAR
jgi:hypothetical protein